MKYLLNPYILGFTILVSEAIINFTVSKVFDFELGAHNVSAMMLFFIAGMLVVQQTKQKMNNSFIVKVLAIYFSIVTIIAVLPLAVNDEFSLFIFLLLLGLMLFFALVSFLSFKWGQSIGMKTVEKKLQQESGQEIEPQQDEAGSEQSKQ